MVNPFVPNAPFLYPFQGVEKEWIGNKWVKRGRILKQFKDFEQLFETAVFIKLTVYFKINLYKFISKYPVFGRPTLSSYYFKNNFRLINFVCRENRFVSYVKTSDGGIDSEADLGLLQHPRWSSLG